MRHWGGGVEACTRGVKIRTCEKKRACTRLAAERRRGWFQYERQTNKNNNKNETKTLCFPKNHQQKKINKYIYIRLYICREENFVRGESKKAKRAFRSKRKDERPPTTTKNKIITLQKIKNKKSLLLRPRTSRASKQASN